MKPCFLLLTKVCIYIFRESIRAENGRLKQVTAFLFHVTKRPDWFPRLLDALKDPRCGTLTHFAEKLDPDGKYDRGWYLFCLRNAVLNPMFSLSNWMLL